MPFPIKTCVICHEEFELRPGKPGFANRCPSCSEPEESLSPSAALHRLRRRRTQLEVAAARRKAMRDLLYRKDS